MSIKIGNREHCITVETLKLHYILSYSKYSKYSKTNNEMESSKIAS